MDMKKEIEFEECCAAYMPLVHSLIRKWRLERERDEYVQVGRIAIYDAWRNYNPSAGPFAAYAKSYICGRMKTAIYKQDKWGTSNLSTDQEILTAISPPANNDAEMMIVLNDWLHTVNLSNREKLWVHEAIFNNLKPKEIAEKYQVQVTTVKSWRKEALQKLRTTKTANGDGSHSPF
ncbi:RNA polymerase sigma factor, sigma-70 family [Evansella cellulosilytica DSM 2522]|uniref:RNA polymerase sigma factor, sigma-70 family n=2 Tax=Evansella TaxID=2837485 RepID=E6TUX7_EVAC2|nr:RNA polymerase sigma factor, sigma-70 family [Evansella cellulosilytica DSM 2522]